MGSNSSKRRPQKTKYLQQRVKDIKKQSRNGSVIHQSSSDESVFPFTSQTLERTKKKRPTFTDSSFSTAEESVKLRLLIEQIAANINAGSLAQIDAALGIRSSKKHEIITAFPGQVEKQAKAMMHQWVRSEPHPSVEKLLGELQSVRLNYEWLLHEGERIPRAAVHPQQPAAVQREKPKEEKQDNTLAENLQTTSLTIVTYVTENQRETEREVKAECGPGNILRMLESAPDPFTKPRALHHWLRTLCIVCDLRPSHVRMLLRLLYGSEWGKVKCHFELPGAGGDDDDWPDADAMITWLDNSCGKSMDETAWEKADLDAIKLCYQMPKELVTDFLKRFQQVWDSTVGLPTEYNAPFMIVTLVNNLQPHVADLFKLISTSWTTYTFSQARESLSEMQRHGILDSKRKALKVAERFRSGLPGLGSGQLQLPAPHSCNQSFHRNPRRNRRRDRCYYCGRSGHWARECRDNVAVQYY